MINTELNTYLTFKVGNHLFGVDVSKVLEISEYRNPQPIPECPPYMTGVIEFRENVVPQINCGIKFGLQPVEITETTCMIVLELFNTDLQKPFKVTIVVDAVSDVFESEGLEKLNMEDDFKPGYIQSSYKTDNGLVLVLDADKVFSDKDIIEIETLIGK